MYYLKAWKQVQANKFSVQIEEYEMAGGDMVFLEASMMNHSCGPNAAVEFPYPGRYTPSRPRMGI